MGHRASRADRRIGEAGAQHQSIGLHSCRLGIVGICAILFFNRIRLFTAAAVWKRKMGHLGTGVHFHSAGGGRFSLRRFFQKVEKHRVRKVGYEVVRAVVFVVGGKQFFDNNLGGNGRCCNGLIHLVF